MTRLAIRLIDLEPAAVAPLLGVLDRVFGLDALDFVDEDASLAVLPAIVFTSAPGAPGAAAALTTVRTDGGRLLTGADAAEIGPSILALAAQLARARAGEPEPDIVLPGSGAPRGTVLFADDNPFHRRVLAAVLSSAGFAYVETPDGEAALAAAGRRRFDLILLDIDMPKRDGFGVLKTLRAGTGPNGATPALAVTAHGPSVPQIVFERAGFAAVVDKPVSAVRLLQAIETALADNDGGESEVRAAG